MISPQDHCGSFIVDGLFLLTEDYSRIPRIPRPTSPFRANGALNGGTDSFREVLRYSPGMG